MQNVKWLWLNSEHLAKEQKQQNNLLLQELPELFDVSRAEWTRWDLAIGATRELMQKVVAPFNKDLHLGTPGENKKAIIKHCHRHGCHHCHPTVIILIVTVIL